MKDRQVKFSANHLLIIYVQSQCPIDWILLNELVKFLRTERTIFSKVGSQPHRSIDLGGN